jgi:hypothetical protein
MPKRRRPKLSFAASGSTQEFELFNETEHFILQSEINDLGAGTFPFKSTEVAAAVFKGPALEVRLGALLAVLVASENPMKFGDVKVNAKKPKKVTFTNIVPLTETAALPEPETTNGKEIVWSISKENCTGAKLKFKESCEVEVTFEPKAKKTYHNRLEIVGWSVVNLEGTGE